MNRVILAAVLCLLSSVANAQDDPKGWLDVNIGVAASAQQDFTSAAAGFIYGEPAALAASYPQPSRGADFDFGGGFMFTPLLGLGVSLSGTAHEDPAGLGLIIPHPFYFNSSATAEGITAVALQRQEGAFHIQLAAVPARSEQFSLRFFGGPSYFRVQQDTVEDISFTQSASPFSRLNVVTVTGFQGREIEGTGWGFHAGADVSVYFSRVLGVGGMLRFSKGSVEVFDPLSELTHDLDAGGVQAGGGLRLRF